MVKVEIEGGDGEAGDVGGLRVALGRLVIQTGIGCALRWED